MPPKILTYNATLSGRENLTDSLGVFHVAPDAGIPEGSWFVPGQYMTIGLNTEDPAKGSVQRPMSIASAPQRRDAVEFYIRYVDNPTSDAPLTHPLWKTAEGDRLFLREKPKGHFTLEHTVGNDDPRLKIFVAAGTGLAPFLSIVRDHHNRNPSARLDRFVMLHGASYPADLGYMDEQRELAERHGLVYLPTVSRPGEARDWNGCTGRVEDFFLEERLEGIERAAGLGPGELSPNNAVVFVCGLQGTIGMSIIRLAERGFVPGDRRLRRVLEIPDDVPASLYYEQYDTEPVIDLDDEELVSGLRRKLATGLP